MSMLMQPLSKLRPFLILYVLVRWWARGKLGLVPSTIPFAPERGEFFMLN